MVGSTVYYLHEDALGSTVLETTSTVSVKFSSNYVPYGKNYAMTGKEVFMYTGKPYDSATGLYYEGARYYDPTTGRFTIQDSITGTQEDPMSLNRYIYARDNPMKIVDLAGHEWWNPISDITSAASAVGSAVSSGVSALSGAVSSEANTVSTDVSDVAGAVSNAWNSLPPVDQAVIATVAVVAVSAVTAGVAAPVLGVALYGTVGLSFGASAAASTVVATAAIGAASSAIASIVIGAAQDNASPNKVLEDAALGAVGGAFSGGATSVLGAFGFTSVAAKVAGQSVAGAISSSVSAYVKTGTVTAPTVVAGAGFGALGGYVGAYSDARYGDSVAAAIVSTGGTNLAQNSFTAIMGVPQVVYPYRWFGWS